MNLSMEPIKVPPLTPNAMTPKPQNPMNTIINSYDEISSEYQYIVRVKYSEELSLRKARVRASGPEEGLEDVDPDGLGGVEGRPH